MKHSSPHLRRNQQADALFWSIAGESRRQRCEQTITAALLHRSTLAMPHMSTMRPDDVLDPLLSRIAFMACGAANLYGKADVKTIARLLPAFNFPGSQIAVQLSILRSIAESLDESRVNSAAAWLMRNRKQRGRAA